MDNDTIKLRLKECSLKAIMDHIYDEYSYFTKLKEIRLSLSDEDDLIDIEFFCDYDKLEKIFANLISNSIKHTGQNGEIVISYRQLNLTEALSNYSRLNDYSFPL